MISSDWGIQAGQILARVSAGQMGAGEALDALRAALRSDSPESGDPWACCVCGEGLPYTGSVRLTKHGPAHWACSDSPESERIAHELRFVEDFLAELREEGSSPGLEVSMESCRSIRAMISNRPSSKDAPQRGGWRIGRTDIESYTGPNGRRVHYLYPPDHFPGDSGDRIPFYGEDCLERAQLVCSLLNGAPDA